MENILYINRLGYDEKLNKYFYYADRNMKWKFYTNEIGKNLLNYIFTINKIIINKIDKKIRNLHNIENEKEFLDKINEGKKIYENKDNINKGNVSTWSKNEYNNLSFIRQYIYLKSIQRFTEGYTLYERIQNIYNIKSKNLKIISIGGGPGYELLGMKKAILNNKKYENINIELISYDSENVWKDITKELNIKFKKYDFNTNDEIEDADIYIFSFVVYHYLNNLKGLKLIETLLKKNSIVLINERVNYIDIISEIEKNNKTVKRLINKRDDRHVLIYNINKNITGSDEDINENIKKIKEFTFPNVPYVNKPYVNKHKNYK